MTSVVIDFSSRRAFSAPSSVQEVVAVAAVARRLPIKQLLATPGALKSDALLLMPQDRANRLLNAAAMLIATECRIGLGDLRDPNDRPSPNHHSRMIARIDDALRLLGDIVGSLQLSRAYHVAKAGKGGSQ